MGSLVGDNGNAATGCKNNSKMLFLSHTEPLTVAQGILVAHSLHFTRGLGGCALSRALTAPPLVSTPGETGRWLF